MQNFEYLRANVTSSGHKRNNPYVKKLLMKQFRFSNTGEFHLKCSKIMNVINRFKTVLRSSGDFASSASASSVGVKSHQVTSSLAKFV